MMSPSDKNNLRIVGTKSECAYTAFVACVLLFLGNFVIMGCGPLVTTDPQSNPLEDADTNSRPKKRWPLKRTLISNEVNCIAADSEKCVDCNSTRGFTLGTSAGSVATLYNGKWTGE